MRYNHQRIAAWRMARLLQQAIAKGYFGDPALLPQHKPAWNCRRCQEEGLITCVCTLTPTHGQHGRPMEGERDVWTQTHGKIPFRLAMGFKLLKQSER